jgi:hypothetical protein
MSSGLIGPTGPIINYLIKKNLGYSNISLNENISTTDASSYPAIISNQIYSRTVPYTATTPVPLGSPTDTANFKWIGYINVNSNINPTPPTKGFFGLVYIDINHPYIQYIYNLPLVNHFNSTSFRYYINSSSVNYFSKVIPPSYGQQYTYILRNTVRTSSGGPSIPYNGNSIIPETSYIIDPDLGVLYIKNGDWDITKYGYPLISFYRYAGPMGLTTNIGDFAGLYSQGTNAIALGNYAGYTGEGANSIAIGAYAGWSGMSSNSTILNASGTGMTTSGPTGGFYVNPIAPSTNSTGPFRLLAYGTDNQVVSITGDNMRNIPFGFGFVTGSTGYFTSFGVESITGGIASFKSLTGSTGSFQFLDTDVVTGSTGYFKYFGADVLTGSTGHFKYLGADVVTGSTGSFKYLGADVLTGSTGSFKYLGADIVTGSTGAFKYLGADVLTGSTGNFKYLGADIVTGSTGAFKYLGADIVTGSTGNFQFLGADVVTGSTGNFKYLGADVVTGSTGSFKYLGADIITGSTGNFKYLGADVVTGSTGNFKYLGADVVTGSTGSFKFLGADVITGSTGNFKYLGADVVTGSTGNFKYLGADVVTGSTGNFKYLAADVVTGSTGNFKYLGADIVTGSTGAFKYLGVDVVTGSTGAFKYLGADIVTGSTGAFKYLSADIVTGSTGAFKYLAADVFTGSTGYFQYLGADVVTGSTGNFKYLASDVVTGSTGNFKFLGADIVTGSTGAFKYLGADVVTGSTGNFKYLGADIITGSTGNFKYLGADVVTGSTGAFKYLGADIVTGSTGYFQYLGTDVVTGSTGHFKFLGADIVTGSTGAFKYLDADVVTGSTGNFKYLSADIVTGSTGTFKYLGADVVTGSTGTFKYLGADVVTGSSGHFKYLGADVVTGSTGYFKYLGADVVTGSSGNFQFLGSDNITGASGSFDKIYANEIRGITGIFSEIRGTTGIFDYLTVIKLEHVKVSYTEEQYMQTATGLYVDNFTGSTGHFRYLGIENATGSTGYFRYFKSDNFIGLTGHFQYLGADVVTGSTGYFKYLDADVVTGSTGSFKHLGADVVTGSTGNFKYLGVDVVTGSTGSFKHLGADVVTGSTGSFKYLGADIVTGSTGNFKYLGADAVTGSTGNFKYLGVDIVTGSTGNFKYLGADVVTGSTGSFKYLGADIVTGSTGNFVSLGSDDIETTNLIFSDGSVMNASNAQTYDYSMIFKNVLPIASVGTSTFSTLSSNGQYQLLASTTGFSYSKDFGASWTTQPATLSLDTTQKFLNIAMSADGSVIVYTEYGIVDSVSGKKGIKFNALNTSKTSNNTITQTLVNADENVQGISISGTGKYISIVTTANMYVSSTYGASWKSPFGINFSGTSMSLSGKYHTVFTSDTVYISSNYGVTFETFDNWINRSGNEYVQVLISASGKYQTIVATNNYIYKSTDYGKTWTGPILQATGGALCTDFSGKILLGKNKSISTDYGATWLTGSATDLTSIAISGSGQYQLFTTPTGNFISALPLTNLIASKIGLNAGLTGQNANAIAIGTNAGTYNQGTGSIAIGYLAGPTGMSANSIALNASGKALYGTGPTGGFYVAPIASYKNSSNPTGPFHLLAYGPDNQIVTVTGATGLNLSLSTPTVTYDSWMLANIIGAPPVVESLAVDSFTTTDVYITFSYPSQMHSGLSQSGLLPYINNMFVNIGMDGVSGIDINGVTGINYIDTNYSYIAPFPGFKNSFSKNFIAETTPVDPTKTVQCINVTKSPLKSTGIGTYKMMKTTPGKILKSYTIPYTSLTSTQLATFYIWYTNNNPNKNVAFIPFHYRLAQNPTQVGTLRVTPSTTSQSITITFTGSDMIDSGDALSTASINYAISYRSIDGSNTYRYGGTISTGVVNGQTIGPTGTAGGAQSQTNSASIYPDTAYSVTVNASNTTLGTGSFTGTTVTSANTTTGPAPPASQTSRSEPLSLNVLSAKSVINGSTITNLLKTTTNTLPSLTRSFNIHNLYEKRGYAGLDPLVNFTSNLSGPVGHIGPSVPIYGFPSRDISASPENGINLSFTKPQDVTGLTGYDGYYLKTHATVSITDASNIVASSNQYTLCVTGTYSTGNGDPASAVTTFYYDGEISPQPSIDTSSISINNYTITPVSGINVVTSISFNVGVSNVSGIGQYFYNAGNKGIISYTPNGPLGVTFTPPNETGLLKLTSGTSANGFNTPISFSNTISLSGIASSQKYYAGPVGVSVTPYNLDNIGGSAVLSNTFSLIFDPVSVAEIYTGSTPKIIREILINGVDVSGIRVAPPSPNTIGNESEKNTNNVLNNLTNGGVSFSAKYFENANSLKVAPYNYELLYINGNYTTTSETMIDYSTYLYNNFDYRDMPSLNGYRYATFAWKLKPNPINFSKVTVKLTGLKTENLNANSGIIGYNNTPIILYCRLEDATSTVSNTLSAINTPWINCNGPGTAISGSNNTLTTLSFTGVTVNASVNSNSVSGSTATFVATLYTINDTSFPSTSTVYLYCRIGLPASAYFSNITANISS